jgi:hypothetical protein
VDEGRHLRFRGTPSKGPGAWPYVIQSDHPDLNGQSGTVTAVVPPADRVKRPSRVHPHWWTDDQDPALAEGQWVGAKTINRYRVDFLRDFATRLDRATSPKRG